MMQVIYSRLLAMYGFDAAVKPCFRNDYVEKVNDNLVCKLFRDFEVQTDSFVQYNKPDIVVIENITKQIVISEGKIPGEMSLLERPPSKTNKIGILVLS